VVDNLKSFLDDLKGLRRDVKAYKTTQIAKRSLRDAAEQLGSRWFSEISPLLIKAENYPAELVEKYSANCAHLIKLSGPNNLKKSYLQTLDSLIKQFRNDFVIPAQQGKGTGLSASSFDSFFGDLANSAEGEYLKEAVGCAKAHYYRAAAVLGWCSAIDRIHRKIEAIGFSTFNVTSAQMASQTKGRFKKFNQVQNVSSLSELREVFDTTILWIIEGMGLIDSNQHTRLRSCFDMRCQGAHPGDAAITEFNLLSFFSDIDQIVLRNHRFAT
jgi:hypothetical protein